MVGDDSLFRALRLKTGHFLFFLLYLCLCFRFSLRFFAREKPSPRLFLLLERALIVSVRLSEARLEQIYATVLRLFYH